MPNPVANNPPAGLPRGTSPGAVLPRANVPAQPKPSGEGDWERITPATRAKVWKKRFGFRSTGTCVCCHQTIIHRDDFVCGQRRASASIGANDVSNLEPICARCSKRMGTHDLVPWCKKFQEELKTVKHMPKTTTVKKPARKTTAKKPVAKKAPAKKAVRKAAAVKKPVRRTAAKKPAARKSRK